MASLQPSQQASVVVPAHDEERVIARLLAALLPPGAPDDIEVVVVCNGCTDRTATLAATFPGVRVVETPVASKREALRLGDQSARGFPRFYIDADVELGRDGVLAVAAALDEPGVLAAAPRRVLPRERVSWAVRWYYDVWEELPGVRTGIFGRGVVALSEAGHQRVSRLPLLMSDDLAMSAAFEEHERRVVPEAVVVVHPPRTWRDLLRRRARVATGTAQAYGPAGGAEHGLRTDSRTSTSDLVGLLRRHPLMAIKLPVFLAAAMISRRHAAAATRRADYTTWPRDNSSR